MISSRVSFLCIPLSVTLLGAAASGLPAEDAPPKRYDHRGDPLPEGVLARIGTVRLRQPLVRCVAFSPDGKVLASGGYDNKVLFWDPVTGKELRSFVGHTKSVNAIAFSPDGKVLASGGQDAAIILWRTTTGEELFRL